MKEFKISFLLMIVAIILSIILFPIGVCFIFFTNLFSKWKLTNLSKYFIKVALSIDQLGTIVMGPLFNLILITKDGYKFDDEDDTISYVLGRNKLRGTLKPLGKFLANTLDKIDEDHCVKAVRIAWEKGSKYCIKKPFL